MSDFRAFTAFAAAALCVCGVALAAPAGQLQHQQKEPVPILKQVNRQNEDGSYSYGYENADGTYKIETKYPSGEVYGKYGYVDETGKLRTVEYGASARGFEPVGTDITVPPPVLGGDTNDLRHQSQDDYDDGQYREDPSVYYKSEQPQQQQQQFRAQPVRQQQQQQQPQQQPLQQQQWFSTSVQKARSDSRQFQAHPAVQGFDAASGSYTISYTGR